MGQLLAAPEINVNAANIYSQTPLLIAQERGYKDIIKILENALMAML
jgi:ankyrin repeat protein